MFRREPYRNRKMLDAARGKSCIRCGADDGTAVAAHYSGRCSHVLGKGISQKADDIFAAHLCAACHVYFDGYTDGNSTERGFEFMLMILKTIRRNLDDGVIK